MPFHLAFDLLASLCALTTTLIVWRWRLQGAAAKVDSAGAGYVLALVAGAAIGGFGLGSLNLWLSGTPMVARSMLGALAGAILAVELYKRGRGIAGSTGLIFVPAFAVSIMVGRWGCYFAGLADDTYGTPTTLPWGHDFGDGVLRHPVQLYESAAMAAFLLYALAMLGTRNPRFLKDGFYLLVLWYAAQRFVWEFLKPYAPVVGPLNVFHLVCLALIAYALLMMRPADERARA
ncbi:MAG: prolipoprotein diacylglyceryl transferase family protein [Hyphomicrobiales bacterium]